MKQVIFCLAISTTMALRLNTHQQEDLQFTIGVVTFPKNAEEPDSNLFFSKDMQTTESVAALWNARREHMIDVQISLTDKSKHRLSVQGPQGESIELHKSELGLSEEATTSLLGEIFKDLEGEAATKLNSCKVSTTAVGHLESGVKKMKKLHGAQVWIIMAPETVMGKAFAAHAPEKSLLLGNGYDGNEFDKYNINGRKVHNLWFPMGFLQFFQREGNSASKIKEGVMMLMDRTKQKDLALKKNLTIVYQQSKSFSERETGWDHMCQGLTSIGQKCYNMGAANGNKHLGVRPPFASAGGRGPTTWIDNAILNYQKFKFVYALEHTRNNFGYLTEKIFLPIQAGAIPVYTGDKAALDMIGMNPKSYIYVTPETRTEAFNEVQALLKNETEFQARVALPVIDKTKFKKYFTFHSSTWEEYGDAARQKLVNAIADLC